MGNGRLKHLRKPHKSLEGKEPKKPQKPKNNAAAFIAKKPPDCAAFNRHQKAKSCKIALQLVEYIVVFKTGCFAESSTKWIKKTKSK